MKAALRQMVHSRIARSTFLTAAMSLVLIKLAVALLMPMCMLQQVKTAPEVTAASDMTTSMAGQAVRRLDETGHLANSMMPCHDGDARGHCLTFVCSVLVLVSTLFLVSKYRLSDFVFVIRAAGLRIIPVPHVFERPPKVF